MQILCQEKSLGGRNRRTLRFCTLRGFVAGSLVALLLTACALFQAPPPPPTVLVPVQGGHNYGQVYVGTTAVSAPLQWRSVSTGSVEVIGVASIDPLFAPNVTPPFAAFTVERGGVTPPFTFNFSPTDAGIVVGDGNLQLLAGSSQFVVLAGEGVFQMSKGDLAVGGRNLVAGEALDFGTVVLPGGEMLREFRLINLSVAPITVNGSFVKGGPLRAGLRVRGPFFLVAPTPPFVLPANGSLVVAVVFRPTAPGVFTDAITFTDANNSASTAGTSLIGRAE